VPGIIAYLWMRVQERILEVVQRRIVELKLPLQSAVGHPAAPLQHDNGLIQHLLKGHPLPLFVSYPAWSSTRWAAPSPRP
jgi:hypothetical protein